MYEKDVRDECSHGESELGVSIVQLDRELRELLQQPRSCRQDGCEVIVIYGRVLENYLLWIRQAIEPSDVAGENFNAVLVDKIQDASRCKESAQLKSERKHNR